MPAAPRHQPERRPSRHVGLGIALTRLADLGRCHASHVPAGGAAWSGPSSRTTGPRRRARPGAEAALDPGFEQPGVGTCYRMSEKELRRCRTASRRVDCSRQAHLRRSCAVTYLPDGLTLAQGLGRQGVHRSWRVKALPAGPGRRAGRRPRCSGAHSSVPAALFVPTGCSASAGARVDRAATSCWAQPARRRCPPYVCRCTDPLRDGVHRVPRRPRRGPRLHASEHALPSDGCGPGSRPRSATRARPSRSARCRLAASRRSIDHATASRST